MNDFAQAHALWTRDGRTARALELYRRAQQQEPADPVIAFLYGCALWSCDRLPEAAAMLAIADRHRDQLRPVGGMLLDQWRDRIRRPPPPADLPLDRDVLERQPDLDLNWRGLAELAAARKMPGLARWALDQWHGVPLDADDLDDLARIERSVANAEGSPDDLRVRPKGSS